MKKLSVALLGKLFISYEEPSTINLEVHKAQELFCYLLLFRDRPHPRERLATLLWGECSTRQSLKYLRKALWQLQAALEQPAQSKREDILLVETDWVQINPLAHLWLDVAVLEQTFVIAQGLPAYDLDIHNMQTLLGAVALYRGDLLEGWYHDWCLAERERFQHMYFVLLDRLMDYCEIRQGYEQALSYGLRILQHDRAHERTHRHLMKLYYLAGDRTAALRQYARCTAILQDELGVKPSKRTTALYEQIRSDELPSSALASPKTTILSESTLTSPSNVFDVITHLEQLCADLATVQHQVEQDIGRVKVALTHS